MTQGFGDLPQAPQPAEGWHQPQRQPADAPPPVRNAVLLMFVRCALGLVAIIVSFATKDELKKRILEKTPTASESTINSAFAIGLVIGIAILAFYLFLAFKVRAGANWARIVTWVFAGLGILGVLLGLAQPSPPVDRALSLIEGVLDLAIVILLALGQSNQYFRRPRY